MEEWGYRLEDTKEFKENQALRDRLKQLGDYKYPENDTSYKRGRKKNLYQFKNHKEYLFYDGEWQDNHMQGHGRIYFRNGEIFEGVLENNQKKKGRKIEIDREYEGEYNEDQ